MGYATRFNLSWSRQEEYRDVPNCEHKPHPTQKFCPECGVPAGVIDLDQVVGTYILNNEDMRYVLSDDGSSGGSGKWYSHWNDMIAMSKAIPTVLFKLRGEGEENGDSWDAYFLNGLGQNHFAQITIAPMDPRAWSAQPKRKGVAVCTTS
jgi:hypothetical protein